MTALLISSLPSWTYASHMAFMTFSACARESQIATAVGPEPLIVQPARSQPEGKGLEPPLRGPGRGRGYPLHPP